MTQPFVLIGGDFVLDHHIYEGRRHHYGDGQSPGVTVKVEKGGAALIHKLLTAVDENDGPILLDEAHVRLTAEQPQEVDESQRAYAFWRPYPERPEGGSQFWRVSEAMGFGATVGRPAPALWPSATDLPKSPEIIVISEGGMGCREERRCWDELNLDMARWIVLKTTAPLCQGPLWEHLSSREEYLRKLIVILSGGELRKARVSISRGLSWEATIGDLLRELGSESEVSELAQLRRCRHLLVVFESEGGVWIDFPDAGDELASTGPGSWKVRFVGESHAIEGEFEHRVPGSAFGTLSCLAASVIYRLARAKGEPDLVPALESGLSAARNLHARGHGPSSEPGDGFPAQRLARVIKEPPDRYSRASFSGSKPEDWSILRDSQSRDDAAYQLARLVVLRGPIALANLPHLRMGKLIATDRSEIEALRTLAELIRFYCDRPGKMPLSIGVFGPPGAGKSFAVSQLARGLVRRGAWLEFNLSQFASSTDLIGAFHQIRDSVLRGLLPVAFFDEFDSKRFDWLQYLLAPMQDGQFQEGQLTHSIGQAIFIFAGATSWTYETFGPSKEADLRERRDFVLAKGPDFKSRLDAFLNVSGPNARWVALPESQTGSKVVEHVSGHSFIQDETDVCFPIRRALMIRSKLNCADDEALEIDEGVLRALLSVQSLSHGARSLDKILQPFQALRPDPLLRSYLPPRRLLEMQTGAHDFVEFSSGLDANLEPPEFREGWVERIAPAIHEAYRPYARAEGGEAARKDVPFDDLPSSLDDEENELGTFYQESNRAAARRMQDILDLVGLRLQDGPWESEGERSAVRDHLESHLEVLAAEEHRGWMDWHLSQGWRHGEVRSDGQRLHPSLRHFSKLPEREKDKDRDAIRAFPDHATVAHARIVFCPWTRDKSS